MIKTENLSRSYGRAVKAVDTVSFEIPDGQIVGLLGPNGAGKTTLMRILTGYHLPSGGKAWINSYDVVEKTREAQAVMGYLPENPPVYPELTVGEYLEFAQEARQISDPDAVERAVTQTALGSVYHKTIGHLSKGYRQRVGLAQAILHDPAILILDEPTNGLDPNQILDFRELLQKLGKEKTVVLSTHILQEVEALCERVLIMHDGVIKADGTVGDIAKGLQGRNRYTLIVKGVTQNKVTDTLSRQGFWTSAPQFLDHPLGLEIRVECATGTDGAEALFDWTVAQGGKILSLIPETSSLESIFSQLTREVPHA